MKKTASSHIIKNGHNIILAIAAILFIAVLFYAALFIDNKEVRAGSQHNVSGWAWSDNIEWISFNCTDTITCGVVDYGVNAAVSGDLSGYAWNNNIGWISFEETDLAGCPSGTCKAELTGGTNLQGWARALSYGDEWDGWISLSGTASDGSDYGPILDINNNLIGYAWDASDISGDKIGIGWIDFNPPFGGVVIDVVPQCSDGADNDNDTLFDEDDPGCWTDVTDPGTYDPNDNDETDPTQCSDGTDNDNDGLADENDPGCYDSGAYDPLDDDEKNTLKRCSNFFDDDGDGLIDYPADLGCGSPNSNNETNPQCMNYLDDDGDGLIDYPDDPGCSSSSDNDEATAQCSDTDDNDGDEQIDIGDPGCYTPYPECVYVPTDDDEYDTLPQCSNCIDDDGDGFVDYEDGVGDPGCSSAIDNREFSLDFREF